MYKYFFKRFFDFVLSLIGGIVLLPVFLIIAIVIYIDDPGPIFFKQKRVGKGKKLFWLHKFRSMKVKTPDIPTHLLENPEQYITRVGKILRKTSLDELPQVYDILFGRMSIIGPRPALWNQDDLVAERDKYGANDIKPGLTGWAQINGRDELEIPVKAKLDGEYTEILNSGKFKGFAMDWRCFFGTVKSVFKSEGVVEGGTGEMKKAEQAKEQIAGTDKVTVVVATYRREEALAKALESLASQSYSPLQIVLVDDNGNEEWNTRVCVIVEEFKKKHPEAELDFIVNSPNQGSAKTRNIGIEAAKGKYVTFLDDDDIYLPDKVRHQYEFMAEGGFDYSITDLELFNESGKLIDKRVRSYIESRESRDLLQYHLKHHMTGTDTMMFTKEYLEKIGGFAPIDVGDEFYLMQRAIEGEGRFGYMKGCDIKAYVHTGEAGLSSGQSKIDGENALYAYKKKYFGKIKAKTRRYIKMRHHAVIAFAQIRRKKYFSFLIQGVLSFLSAPIACIKMLIGER